MIHDPIVLTSAQAESLDLNGYAIFPDVLPADHVAVMEAYLDTLLQEQIARMLKAGQSTGKIDWGPEVAVVNLELDQRHPLLDGCCRHPLLMAAVTQVLGGGAIVKKVHSRAPLPGGGHQGLHTDFKEPGAPGRWLEVQATWCIREHTEHNGPTRVIPGSHLSATPPIGQEFGAGMKPHPREIKLVGRPGTLIVFNPHLWHSGTFNYSPLPRSSVAVRFGKPGVGA